jgi:putative copper resistance protein D
VSPDLLSVAIRALAFVCLFQAAGVAFFLALFGSSLGQSESGIRRLGFYAALAGLPLFAAQRWIAGARMSNDYAGLTDPALQQLAWGGNGGNAAVLQMLGLALIAFGLLRRVRQAPSVAGAGAVIAACAFTLAGHTSDHPQSALLAPLLCVHLLLVSFWFGALLPLIICSRRESASNALAVLRTFSAMAGWLVPALGVAGLTMAMVLIVDRSGWRATYGLLLLGKLGAFGVLLLLAAWNRWQLVPAMAAGSVPGIAAARGLRRMIALEYLIMVAIFAGTAVLTTFYSPER